MSALILRPKGAAKGIVARLFGLFNRGFDWTMGRYLSGVKGLIRKSAWALVALACVFLAAGGLFKILPSGFLPDEDQGVFFVSVRLPDGASLGRTQRVVSNIEKMTMAMPGVADVTTFGGLDIATQTNNSNVATIIASLIPWEERSSKDLQLASILARAQRQYNQVEEALAFGFGLPPILGLSTAGGFEFMLEDRAGGDVNSLAEAAQAVVDAARQRTDLTNVVSSFRNSVPQYKVDLDNDKAQTLGIPVTDVYNALQTGVAEATDTTSGSFVSFRLYEQLKCVTAPGDNALFFMYEPVLISKKSFERLDKKQQEALLAAGRKAQDYFAKEAKGLDDEMVKAFKQHNVEVVTLNPTEYAV